jgi:hypothetical protein
MRTSPGGYQPISTLDRAAHRHAEPRMDYRGAMLEVAADADHGGLGVGAQLGRACAERRRGERSVGSTE